jgi:Skp family chaperone for outer membrane proteins
MTTIMIVMICVGCAAIIAGLAALGVQSIRLAKNARNAGLANIGQIQAVIRRGEKLAPRLDEFAHNQKDVAERLENLSATSQKLSYLADSLDEASSRVSKLKS